MNLLRICLTLPYMLYVHGFYLVFMYRTYVLNGCNVWPSLLTGLASLVG